MNIKPVEYKCVVRLFKVEDADPLMASAKAAGIEIPQQMMEREQQAQVKAEMMAIGGNAFEDFKGLRPETGDTVLVAKYAGLLYEEEGVEYRIINDKDVCAVLS